VRAEIEARYWDLHNRAAAIGVDTSDVDTNRTNWLALIAAYSPGIDDYTADTRINFNVYSDESWTHWGTATGATIATSATDTILSDTGASLGEVTRGSADFGGPAYVPGEYSALLVFKKDAVTARRPCFRLVFEGSPTVGAKYGGMIINTTNGQYIADPYGNLGLDGMIVYDLGDGYYAAVVIATGPADATSVRIQILPAFANSSNVADGALTGSITVRTTPILARGWEQNLGRGPLNGKLYTYSYALTSLAKAISERDGITSVVMNPIPDVVIRADSNGVIKAGQLPRDIALKASAGTADVTALCAWSKTDPSGVTSSMGASTGILTLSAFSVNEAFEDVQFTYAGVVTRAAKVHIIKVNDPPPTTGGTGGGGGGTGGSSGSTSTLGDTTGTGYDFSNAISNEIPFNTGSLGKVDLSADISFERTSASNGQTSATGKWQIKPPGGSYADVAGSEASSLANARTTNPTGDPTNQEQGSLHVQPATVTGLTANTSGYKARFCWHDNAVSGVASRLTGVFNSMSAAGS
jgi:hypothetical protein